MTAPTRHPTALELRAHALQLAKAFDVRLIQSAQLKPDEALGITGLRVALCTAIVDETTYAVALHEIGHLAAPTGFVRGVCDGPRANLLRIEEDAAWTWARHYALVWTPPMQAVALWAEGTYRQADRSAEPPAPVAPKASIDWTKY